MKRCQLIDLFDKLILVNVNWIPLEEKNLEGYLSILADIPDGIFNLAAADIVRQDHYVWPSAGKIYEAARRYWPTESDRLFEKTLHWLKTNQPGTHDEWPKIRGALKYIGKESALLEADNKELDFLKRKWMEYFNREAGIEALRG